MMFGRTIYEVLTTYGLLFSKFFFFPYPFLPSVQICLHITFRFSFTSAGGGAGWRRNWIFFFFSRFDYDLHSIYCRAGFCKCIGVFMVYKDEFTIIRVPGH